MTEPPKLRVLPAGTIVPKLGTVQATDIMAGERWYWLKKETGGNSYITMHSDQRVYEALAEGEPKP